MTKSLWITSVAALALATPTVAHADIDVSVQKQDRQKDNKKRAKQKAQAAKQHRQKARANRADSRQQARAQQRQHAKAQQRQQARAERKQQARAQKQQARAQERRAERRQQARAQQRNEARAEQRRAAKRAERRAENRAQKRVEPRRDAKRAQIAAERRAHQRAAALADRRADRIRAERRADIRQDRIRDMRRAETRRDKFAEQRAKEIRKYRQRDLKERRKAYKAAQKRLERQTVRRAAYRDWVRDRERDRYRTYRDGYDRARFVTVGSRISPDWYSSRVPYYYRNSYVDDRNYYYRYDDDLDYLYRVDRDRNRVRSIIPLSYSYGLIGQRLPTYYQSGYAPNGYSRYYYDTPNNYYRTVGPAVYRMNPETQLLTAVVALLTGSNFNVGSMMPTGYNAYNVPIAYRDRYYDTPDSWYRYNNGSIYQINPNSRMVTASYPLYDANYGIGQQWPTAYPDYNVPYGYQGMYYDTPQYDYRYAQGRIYQVDPETQLITALASLVTGNDFTVGQPMPAGYDVYNVPNDYRDRFADGGDNWYRYSDGYVYAVDPSNRMITDSYAIYT